MENALCCFLLLVLVVGACFHLPFIAFHCTSLLFLVFEIESILSPKQTNAFCCSLWLFVARFGFLWMFPFEHRIARCGFSLVRKTKTSNKRQKISKWKPISSENHNGMNLGYLGYCPWRAFWRQYRLPWMCEVLTGWKVIFVLNSKVIINRGQNRRFL